MIVEGTLVAGNRNQEKVPGVVVRCKGHKREDTEVILVEVLFQKPGFNRAIYAYSGKEFFIIKDCDAAPAALELV